MDGREKKYVHIERGVEGRKVKKKKMVGDSDGGEEQRVTGWHG